MRYIVVLLIFLSVICQANADEAAGELTAMGVAPGVALIGDRHITALFSQEGKLVTFFYPTVGAYDFVPYYTGQDRNAPFYGAPKHMGAFLGLVDLQSSPNTVFWLPDSSLPTIDHLSSVPEFTFYYPEHQRIQVDMTVYSPVDKFLFDEQGLNSIVYNVKVRNTEAQDRTIGLAYYAFFDPSDINQKPFAYDGILEPVLHTEAKSGWNNTGSATVRCEDNSCIWTKTESPFTIGFTSDLPASDLLYYQQGAADTRGKSEIGAYSDQYPIPSEGTPVPEPLPPAPSSLGEKNAIMIWKLDIPAGETRFLRIIVSAGDSYQETKNRLEDLKTRDTYSLNTETIVRWSDFLSQLHRNPFYNKLSPEDQVKMDWWTMTIALMADAKTGAIIGAPTLTPKYYGSWPRDGVDQAIVWTALGYQEIAEKYYVYLFNLEDFKSTDRWFQNYDSDTGKYVGFPVPPDIFGIPVQHPQWGTNVRDLNDPNNGMVLEEDQMGMVMLGLWYYNKEFGKNPGGIDETKIRKLADYIKNSILNNDESEKLFDMPPTIVIDLWGNRYEILSRPIFSSSHGGLIRPSSDSYEFPGEISNLMDVPKLFVNINLHLFADQPRLFAVRQSSQTNFLGASALIAASDLLNDPSFKDAGYKLRDRSEAIFFNDIANPMDQGIDPGSHFITAWSTNHDSSHLTMPYDFPGDLSTFLAWPVQAFPYDNPKLIQHRLWVENKFDTTVETTDFNRFFTTGLVTLDIYKNIAEDSGSSLYLNRALTGIDTDRIRNDYLPENVHPRVPGTDSYKEHDATTKPLGQNHAFAIMDLLTKAGYKPPTLYAPSNKFKIIRVSVSSDGSEGNYGGIRPSISADGRFVAFESDATNLVNGDTNGKEDIFLHDRITGETSLVSVSSGGGQGNGGSYTPSISADGRFVAFESDASNLVSGDTNRLRDVFLHDRITGETSLVSVSSGGVQGIWGSAEASISADGRLIVFVSDSYNLVSPNTNGMANVFLHDRITGETSLVSVSSGGDEINGFYPSISADGRFVAFSRVTKSGNTYGPEDVYVRDRSTGETSRITEGNADSMYPSISADGRFVAFVSTASNLVSGDTNGVADVFLHDRITGETSRVSLSSGGDQGNGQSITPSISANGRYIAFVSGASNLVSGDTNGAADVFLHDRITGETSRVSLSSGGDQGNGHCFGTISISADGRCITFSSFASNLVSGDTNGDLDVFLTEIEQANSPPIADAGSDLTGQVSMPITLDGSGSHDTDGTIVSYVWDFGDGSSGSGETATHIYNAQGTYTATLTVTDNNGLTGSDTALIKIGSVTNPYTYGFQWGSYGTGDGQFNWPKGIAINESGFVYVVDQLNNRIQVFSENGYFIRKWGSSGTGNSQFNIPIGIAIHQGRVYVADTENHRVQVFDEDGNYITQWGTYGQDNGQFNRPTNVAIGPDEAIYVTDSNNDRIQKCDLEGKCTFWLGSSGSGPGQFSRPQQLAFDSTGNIYVTDVNNFRIQKFGPSGNFNKPWGSYGTGNGQFYYATAIAINSSNYVIVGDSNNHRFQVFDSDGDYISQWGSHGSGDGQFDWIGGFALTPTGTPLQAMYVSDTGNHRIEVFGKERMTPPEETRIEIIVHCPVYLVVTDPGGHVVSKTQNEIPGAVYLEQDLDNDNSPDGKVVITQPTLGDYQIMVIPKENAEPTDTYTLEASMSESTIILIQDQPISSIPSTPLILRYSQEGISCVKCGGEEVPVPEFPTMAIPLAIVGVIAIVVLIVKKRMK